MKKVAIVIFAVVFSTSISAQDMNSYVQEGEFGVALGGAHYFGDINNRASVDRAKFSAGVFFS